MKILIVEDNLSFALELEMLVDEIGYDPIGRADNGADALDLIYNKKPDLILMDIELKGNLTGVQIGEMIKHMNIPIIFITSFYDQEHYDAAQKSNIVGYLIKPPNEFSLRTAINSAMMNLAKRNPKEENKNPEPVLQNEKDEENVILKDVLFLKKKKSYFKIEVKDIQCVEADGNYSIFYVEEQKFMSKFKLSYLETILSPDKFMRVHRGYIMNLEYFDSIDLDENVVKTKNGKSVLISRSNKQNLLERMKMG